MKRLFAFTLLFAIIISSSFAYAESDFLQLAEDYLGQVVDLSEKQSACLSATGYDPSLCIISFDFTDGNQSIVAIDADECEVFFFFDDNELMSTLFQMITLFGEVEEQLTDGKSLQYEMRFSETEIHYITSPIIEEYYT